MGLRFTQGVEFRNSGAQALVRGFKGVDIPEQGKVGPYCVAGFSVCAPDRDSYPCIMHLLPMSSVEELG